MALIKISKRLERPASLCHFDQRHKKRKWVKEHTLEVSCYKTKCLPLNPVRYNRITPLHRVIVITEATFVTPKSTCVPTAFSSAK